MPGRCRTRISARRRVHDRHDSGGDERGPKGKRVVAYAIEWPGWSRWGKTSQDAIDALIAHRDRYNEVLTLEHVRHIPADTSQLEIVQTVPGSATTDFGAPDKAFEVEDDEPLEGTGLQRVVRIVRASWTYLDQTASTVSEKLQKGPRGGGRDRSKMLAHVLEAERSYVRFIGVKSAAMAIHDMKAIDEHRDAVTAAIERYGKTGDALPKSWSLRYCVRRMVWHTLDHAWEMQDKDLTGKVSS